MMGANDEMVTSGGATLSSVSKGGCTMRISIPWEPAVRAAAVVERNQIILHTGFPSLLLLLKIG